MTEVQLRLKIDPHPKFHVSWLTGFLRWLLCVEALLYLDKRNRVWSRWTIICLYFILRGCVFSVWNWVWRYWRHQGVRETSGSGFKFLFVSSCWIRVYRKPVRYCLDLIVKGIITSRCHYPLSIWIWLDDEYHVKWIRRHFAACRCRF